MAAGGLIAFGGYLALLAVERAQQVAERTVDTAVGAVKEAVTEMDEGLSGKSGTPRGSGEAVSSGVDEQKAEIGKRMGDEGESRP